MTDSRERAIRSAQTAADNRGRNILVLDMTGLVPWVDYMVLATGASRRQILTITEEIQSALQQLGEQKTLAQGTELGAWVVLDYGDIIVHVFDEQKREYYQLEHLWADAPRVDWERPADQKAQTEE